jgi:enoyl-CoA hydratase/carnithine racemase
VTFDHPLINTITATTVAELSDLAGLIEQDPDLNVVVFDSANRDFYLSHYDLENDPGRTEALGVGPTCPSSAQNRPEGFMELSVCTNKSVKQ